MMRIATNPNYKFKILIAITIITTSMLLAFFLVSLYKQDQHAIEGVFDGQRAFENLRAQVELGPRIPGSLPHQRTIEYIEDQLRNAGWDVQIQETLMSGKPIKNIIAHRQYPQNYENRPWIVLGAHYDTRMVADKDPEEQNRQKPVPGANDGASGVAVLLEIARVLPKNLNKNVWLVFFDAEDNGNIPGWDWTLGSQAFVNSLVNKPDAAVIVDMVGDSDLNIYIEKNSSLELITSIWNTASKLGYTQYFIPIPKYSIRDDHTPFLNANIPAVDIIDFDYVHWHTTHDTLDKVSKESLKFVGDVVVAWLTSDSE